MTDLFTETEGNTTETKETEQPEAVVTELVGADKKFKTIDDLAKAKLESDRFIEQLKEEAAEMREALKEKEKAGEEQATIDKLMAKLTETSTTKGEGNQSDLTEEVVRKLIGEEVSVREHTKVKNTNREKANIVVLEKFANDSEKAKAFVAEQTKKLGLTTKQLGDIAETSPDAFTRLMGIAPDNTATSGSPVQPTKNTEAMLQLDSTGERNMNYYRQLRKSLGAKFYEPRIQQQKMKDAERLGDAFFAD